METQLDPINFLGMCWIYTWVNILGELYIWPKVQCGSGEEGEEAEIKYSCIQVKFSKKSGLATEPK